jgi:hypothetical protein
MEARSETLTPTIANGKARFFADPCQKVRKANKRSETGIIQAIDQHLLLPSFSLFLFHLWYDNDDILTERIDRATPTVATITTMAVSIRNMGAMDLRIVLGQMLYCGIESRNRTYRNLAELAIKRRMMAT